MTPYTLARIWHRWWVTAVRLWLPTRRLTDADTAGDQGGHPRYKA
jgi:hypothetical protein